jgi:hypothetical protein
MNKKGYDEISWFSCFLKHCCLPSELEASAGSEEMCGLLECKHLVGLTCLSCTNFQSHKNSLHCGPIRIPCS